jgi:hypothetical protein
VSSAPSFSDRNRFWSTSKIACSKCASPVEIDEPTFVRKQTKLRDQLASIRIQLEVVSRSHEAMTDLAVKVLNFCKPFATSGLVPTTQQNGGFWKPSFGTAASTTELLPPN